MSLLYCTSWWWSLEVVVKPQTNKPTQRSLTCWMFSCQEKKKKSRCEYCLSHFTFNGVGNTEYVRSLREVRPIKFKGCCTLNVTVSVSVCYFPVLWFGVSGLYFLFYLGVVCLVFTLFPMSCLCSFPSTVIVHPYSFHLVLVTLPVFCWVFPFVCLLHVHVLLVCSHSCLFSAFKKKQKPKKTTLHSVCILDSSPIR